MKTLHDLKNSLKLRFERVDVEQAKYYNKKHKFMFFDINNLIMFSIKNLKQKRFLRENVL